MHWNQKWWFTAPRSLDEVKPGSLPWFYRKLTLGLVSSPMASGSPQAAGERTMALAFLLQAVHSSHQPNTISYNAAMGAGHRVAEWKPSQCLLLQCSVAFCNQLQSLAVCRLGVLRRRRY